MVITENLTYAYAGGQTLQFPDLSCGANEHWLILGNSGSGKTTLLQLLAGIRRPASGSVKVGDTLLQKLSDSALDQFRGKQIGLVFQQAHFFQALTVQENLELAQKLAGNSIDPKFISGLLEGLGIAYKKKDRPVRLSQGEQQRLAIARALVNRPTVILADEPTSALDDDNCAIVSNLLKTQAEVQSATLLMVTHDQRLKDQFQNQIVLDGKGSVTR